MSFRANGRTRRDRVPRPSARRMPDRCRAGAETPAPCGDWHRPAHNRKPAGVGRSKQWLPSVSATVSARSVAACEIAQLDDVKFRSFIVRRSRRVSYDRARRARRRDRKRSCPWPRDRRRAGSAPSPPATRLAADDRILAARAVPVVIEERAVVDRDIGIVFLDPCPHFRDELLLQISRRRQHLLGIGILGHRATHLISDRQGARIAQNLLPVRRLEPCIVVGECDAVDLRLCGRFSTIGGSAAPKRDRRACSSWDH